MKKQPLLSIVTVVYNGENFIEKTIKSVISQSFKDFEYIIIDGKSSDNTVKIIKKYGKQINYWSSEPDEGIYDAMNKGISKCKGKYIGLINASDWYMPDAFMHVAALVTKDKSIDVIYSDLFTFNDLTKKTKFFRSFASYAILFWLETRVFHPTLFVRRSIYTTLKYDQTFKIVSDLKLILQMFKKKYRFAKSEIPLSTYSLGGTSSSGWKILNEELKMKKQLGSSNIIIFLSTITKFIVMGCRLIEVKIQKLFF